MDEAARFATRWVLVGSWSGIIAAVSYIALVVANLPDSVVLALIALYCVGLGLSGVGLGVLLKLHRPSVGAWVAPRMLLVGGAIMALMLVVQQTIMGYMRVFLAAAETTAEHEGLLLIDRALVAVHLGMDVAWDIFLLAATIPFAWHLLTHPRFGRVWGGIGLLLAAVLSGVELWAFPISPYEQGAPYLLGPLLALWYLGVHLRVLASVGWVTSRVRDGQFSTLSIAP